jgi:hypothetical protein
MSLRAWLSRPLALFRKWTWMSRIRLWPAGLESNAGRPLTAGKLRKRSDTQPALEVLEGREVPQSLFQPLQAGISIAGETLTGHLLTPKGTQRHWDPFPTSSQGGAARPIHLPHRARPAG